MITSLLHSLRAGYPLSGSKSTVVDDDLLITTSSISIVARMLGVEGTLHRSEQRIALGLTWMIHRYYLFDIVIMINVEVFFYLWVLSL